MKKTTERIAVCWLFLRLLIGIATVMVAISYLMDENRLAADVPKYIFLLVGASLATIYAVMRHRDRLHRYYSGVLIVAAAGEVLTVSIVRNTYFACPLPLAVQQYNALEQAIETHDLAAVNAILTHDAQPDYTPLPTGGDSSQRRLLDVAVESGDVAIVDTLRQHGAVLNRDDRSSFDLLIANHNLAMLRYLVQHGVAVNDREGNCEALWCAVDQGHEDGVACLLALGANPKTPTPPQYVISGNEARPLAETGAVFDSAEVYRTPAYNGDTTKGDTSSLLKLAQSKKEYTIVGLLKRAGAK